MGMQHSTIYLKKKKLTRKNTHLDCPALLLRKVLHNKLPVVEIQKSPYIQLPQYFRVVFNHLFLPQMAKENLAETDTSLIFLNLVVLV